MLKCRSSAACSQSRVAARRASVRGPTPRPTVTGVSRVMAATAGAGSLAGAADTDTNTDLTADTFVVTRWEYNGSDKVRFYVDGVLTNTLTANIPKDQYMSPIFLLDNSGAAAETLSIDYILCVNERG